MGGTTGTSRLGGRLVAALGAFVVAFSVLAVDGAGASTPVSVSAVNAGWFDATGFHDGLSTNYFTGSTSLAAYRGGRVRSFFVFDLSGVSGHIESAQLSVRSYGGTGAPDTLTLRDVSTPPATLAASATGATQVFDDLGSGTSFGAAMVPDPTATTIVVPLSATGVSALQAAIGGTFAVGGDYAANDSSGRDIFESTGGGNGAGPVHPLSDVQLVLTLAPVSTTTTMPHGAIPTTSTTRGTSATVATSTTKPASGKATTNTTRPTSTTAAPGTRTGASTSTTAEPPSSTQTFTTATTSVGPSGTELASAAGRPVSNDAGPGGVTLLPLALAVAAAVVVAFGLILWRGRSA